MISQFSWENAMMLSREMLPCWVSMKITASAHTASTAMRSPLLSVKERVFSLCSAMEFGLSNRAIEFPSFAEMFRRKGFPYIKIPV